MPMKFIEKLKNHLDSIDWLPSYIVKESKQAKYMRLCAELNGNLELIIPKRRPSVQAIIDFIKSKQNWIQKYISESSITLKTLPHIKRVMHMPINNEVWHIVYIRSNVTKVIVSKDSRVCTVFGYNNNPELANAKINSWLKSYAKEKIKPFLDNLASTMNLTYNKLNIRSQKTIWGSCNSKGNISLNYKLIFLDKPLCEYILVHELCHLKHMNHSNEFWKLVEKYIPNYKESVIRLKRINF